MKKTLLLVLSFTMLQLSSQTLEVNKVDEFTGVKIKSTSWEKLTNNKAIFKSYICLRKIDSTSFVNLKIAADFIFSVHKGSELMFKLESGDIIKLSNRSYNISSRGEGSINARTADMYGTNTRYLVTLPQLDSLKNNRIVKIRVYLSRGYIEGDVDQEESSLFGKSIDLFLKD